MTFAECEIVADAGTRLRIIADGLLAASDVLQGLTAGLVVIDGGGDSGETGYIAGRAANHMRVMARHVDEVRVRLCALPIEAEETQQEKLRVLWKLEGLRPSEGGEGQ